MNKVLITRRGKWIDHVLQKKHDSISKTAFRWTLRINKMWTTQKHWRKMAEKNSNKYTGAGAR